MAIRKTAVNWGRITGGGDSLTEFGTKCLTLSSHDDDGDIIIDIDGGGCGYDNDGSFWNLAPNT